MLLMIIRVKRVKHVKKILSFCPQFFLDAFCTTLSEAIKNGREEQAVEIVRKLVFQNLHLSIKLKNPSLVTMDSGSNTIK